MIYLKLLSLIDSQLSKVKGKKDDNMAILGDLTFDIVIEDFYQFLPVVGKSL